MADSPGRAPRKRPKVPEFIPQELQESYASEAHSIVRGLAAPAAEPAAPEVLRPAPGWLDGLRTVLAGFSIAVAVVMVAIGLVFLWVSAPRLAYLLLAASAVAGTSWLATLAWSQRYGSAGLP